MLSRKPWPLLTPFMALSGRSMPLLRSKVRKRWVPLSVSYSTIPPFIPINPHSQDLSSYLPETASNKHPATHLPFTPIVRQPESVPINTFSQPAILRLLPLHRIQLGLLRSYGLFQNTKSQLFGITFSSLRFFTKELRQQTTNHRQQTT